MRLDSLVLGVKAVVAGLLSHVGNWVACLRYRYRELLVVAALAAAVLAGFAVEMWHRQAPGPLDRVETEPPRLAPATPGAARHPEHPVRTVHAWPRSSGSRGEPRQPVEPPARAETPPAPTAEHPLDLNQATAAQLTELPGIGPRLAARILARRDVLGGRFESPDDLATVPGLGARRAARLRPLVRVTGERSTPVETRPIETGTVPTEITEASPPARPPDQAEGLGTVTEPP